LVTVHIRKDSRGRLSSFLATGHAGWAEAGSDVVCAAVSTVLQAAWVGLTEVAGLKVSGMRRRSRLELVWPAAARSRPAVRAIARTAALSLGYLSVQYPDQLRVLEEAEDG